jgi:diaminohydroxyphosphoribosylaminopyrimidine deaminase/5-amino-6-(5-phosphoribosylamino)uracil reductase
MSSVRAAGRRTPRASQLADERFMSRALELAARGLGRTHPNPAVGAVVARGGRILGEGYHRRAGAAHAEVIALRRAGPKVAGGTLYVTLEPCAHFGRTPPCVDAVLKAGVARVVVGTLDPNPLVRGRGARRLRRAGIEVTVGVLGAPCRRVLAGYLTMVTAGRPLVVLKLAASLDGRIAIPTGGSRWITGAVARRRAHEMRNRLDAVLVGGRTIRTDDPRLTCRLPGGRDPIRVVLDGQLRVSPRSRVIRVRSRAPTWIVTRPDAPARRAAALERAGAEVIRVPGHGPVQLRRVMRELGRRGVTSVLVEGGATVAAATLRARVADRVVLFLAPILIGGDGVPAIGALMTSRVARAVQLKHVRVERVGGDLVVEATLPFSPVAL